MTEGRMSDEEYSEKVDDALRKLQGAIERYFNTAQAVRHIQEIRYYMNDLNDLFGK